MNRRIEKLALLILVIIAATLGWSCAPPTAQIKVSRNEIEKGDPVTVSWETKNAKQVQLDGQPVEKVGAKTVTPEQTTTYELLAKRGRKEARDSATVNVRVKTIPAPTITLRAEPDAIEHGQSAKLIWTTTNAKVVTISGLGDVPVSGEREVSPRVSTTYTGTAVGEGGTATAGVRITVTEPPPPPPPVERPRVTQPPEPAIEEQFARAVTAIFFDFDKAELKPSEQEKLRRAAEWLLQDRNRSIVFRIEGNCDPRGTAEYNLGLGDRRARAARNFLVSLGVDAARIETVSYGLEKAQGTSEGAPDIIPSWAHDRRDDFVYLRGGERR